MGARLKGGRTELQIVDVSGGVQRNVQYSQLDHHDKENVLADLLVKSAINHALEKQKQVCHACKRCWWVLVEYV